MDLSLIIHTKNAAKTLGKSIESVAGLVDELILIDMQSHDQTKNIAKKYKAKIFEVKDVGYADPFRNFGLAKATKKWTLVLDADETIGYNLKKSIKKIIANSNNQTADGYYLSRKNIIWKKWIQTAGWWPDYQLRLFKTGSVEWPTEVHGQPICSGKVIYLPAEENLAIIHQNYQTIDQFIDRLNRYTSLEKMSKILSSSSDPSQVSMEKFTQEFLRRLFQLSGIEMGIHGLSLSLSMGFYQFIAYLKEYERKGFKETKNDQMKIVNGLEHFISEYKYQKASYFFNHRSGLEKIYWRIKMKLASF